MIPLRIRMLASMRNNVVNGGDEHQHIARLDRHECDDKRQHITRRPHNTAQDKSPISVTMYYFSQ